MAFALRGKKANGRKLSFTEEEGFEIADHVIRDMRKHGQWAELDQQIEAPVGLTGASNGDRNITRCKKAPARGRGEVGIACVCRGISARVSAPGQAARPEGGAVTLFELENLRDGLRDQFAHAGLGCWIKRQREAAPRGVFLQALQLLGYGVPLDIRSRFFTRIRHQAPLRQLLRNQPITSPLVLGTETERRR